VVWFMAAVWMALLFPTGNTKYHQSHIIHSSFSFIPYYALTPFLLRLVVPFLPPLLPSPSPHGAVSVPLGVATDGPFYHPFAKILLDLHKTVGEQMPSGLSLPVHHGNQNAIRSR